MKTVICSGYWNPLHTGHLDYLEAARNLGDRLWVIVNNDQQVKLKGSSPFMACGARLRIIKGLRIVDQAFLSFDEDKTVCETLAWLGETAKLDGLVVFANGGDQTVDTVPEMAVCEKLRIDMQFGVGGAKVTSSSELIEAAQ